MLLTRKKQSFESLYDSYTKKQVTYLFIDSTDFWCKYCRSRKLSEDFLILASGRQKAKRKVGRCKIAAKVFTFPSKIDKNNNKNKNCKIFKIIRQIEVFMSQLPRIRELWRKKLVKISKQKQEFWLAEFSAQLAEIKRLAGQILAQENFNL